MALSSIIYLPVATLAHLQPVSIPGSFALLSGFFSFTLLASSRLIYKVTHKRFMDINEATLSSEPRPRIILIGGGARTKRFLQELEAQHSASFDVLGVIDDTLYETTSHICDSEVLGKTSDLFELIEGFNADGLHPHYVCPK